MMGSPTSRGWWYLFTAYTCSTHEIQVPRDIKNRGRDLDQVLNQYMNFVKPAFEEFCSPTKKYADVIIPRGADNTVGIDLIVHHIQDLLHRSGTSKCSVRLSRCSSSCSGTLSRYRYRPDRAAHPRFPQQPQQKGAPMFTRSIPRAQTYHRRRSIHSPALILLSVTRHVTLNNHFT
uniref:Phosphoribulokinase/uridine kinase domain-containing protein n=1 Tax=Timema tahoe TaxID=61484 RepID=A0A7R9IGL8_9NEOP|nr:unnamed protein product [Timema tahoe]